MTSSWDEIPSIDNLSLDWDYEPENPLGKRSTLRLDKKQLYKILGENSVMVNIAPMTQVQVMTRKNYEKGILIDLSEDGLAVLLAVKLAEETRVKVGFFLGKRKIISRGIVRNAGALSKNYRVGIEFVQLNEEDAVFIKSLHSSAVYKT